MGSRKRKIPKRKDWFDGLKLQRYVKEHLGACKIVRMNEAARLILEHYGAEVPEGKMLRPAALKLISGGSSTTSLPFIPSYNDRKLFYDSWEWKKLRMQALKKNEGRCECCGATAHDLDSAGEKVSLHVDHIKPIAKYWELRLDLENLQVLCKECNQGKGSWDETDWRE